jgi:hypothetical protein
MQLEGKLELASLAQIAEKRAEKVKHQGGFSLKNDN